MHNQQEGLQQALAYPLFNAIFQRRSRRISKGIRSVSAGSLSYTSDEQPQPLSPLEEALLIAVTGITGLTMPDMPFQTEEGKELLGTPMLELRGRAASSADNAQATHFFLINDTGTYFLKRPEVCSQQKFSTTDLIAHAEQCKVKVLEQRLDFPRHFPCYAGRNGYVSNVPGSTMLVPIVDMTRQYINVILYLLSQEDGLRPAFIDDWNFYRPAGVKKWMKNGFVNKKIPTPLGLMGTFRTHIEADLLMQNLLLAIQAMGLGGWVHGGFVGPLLLGDSDYARYGPGLQFRFAKPQKIVRQFLKFITPLPAWKPNPVGLDGVIEGFCPPYYKNMSEAVDALLELKYGKQGLYTRAQNFEPIFRQGLAEKFVDEVPHYSAEVIACTKDICSYIYETYGRFPAHVDAMFVPGVWIQAHHLDLAYYDKLYRDGYTETQAQHQRLWHNA